MASGASHEGQRAGVEARGVGSVEGERNESCWGKRMSEGGVEGVAEHELLLPLPFALLSPLSLSKLFQVLLDLADGQGGRGASGTSNARL